METILDKRKSLITVCHTKMCRQPLTDEARAVLFIYCLVANKTESST
ncbi:rCG57252 [Rattus norvegicus]|uniref:RCG57252 n=1 Tax=Rattus norvegicus TaxID=10116 RepID=A6KPI7_RAT|nr:rCG57252 [Rattus norvegicus]